MKHSLSFLLFCLILLSGCKSAEHYYQQGQSAAQAGNQDAAAQLYLQSLSKDAQFTPAKNEALLHLKNLAQNSFKLSEEATKSVQHVKAYKVLKAYEIFKAQLEAVSPTKSENKAFNAYKSLKQSAAVKELLAQSDRAKENSDVAVAMKQLQTIESCEPTKEQQKQVTSRQKALGKIVFDQQIALMRKLFKMENFSGARKALDLAKVHATETEEQKLVTQLSVAIDQAEDEERAKMDSQRIAYLPIFCPIADVSLDNLSELKKSLKHDGTKGFSNIPEEEVQKALLTFLLKCEILC